MRCHQSQRRASGAPEATRDPVRDGSRVAAAIGRVGAVPRPQRDSPASCPRRGPGRARGPRPRDHGHERRRGARGSQVRDLLPVRRGLAAKISFDPDWPFCGLGRLTLNEIEARHPNLTWYTTAQSKDARGFYERYRQNSSSPLDRQAASLPAFRLRPLCPRTCNESPVGDEFRGGSNRALAGFIVGWVFCFEAGSIGVPGDRVAGEWRQPPTERRARCVPDRTANQGDPRSLTDSRTRRSTCVKAAQNIWP